MRKRITAVYLISVLLLMVILTACGSDTEKPASQPTETQVTAVPTEAVEPTQPSTEDDPYVTVSTPYGDLYYQDQWESDMIVEQKMEGESATVSFSTAIHDTTYSLFSVTIGPGEGALVGELTDASGIKREVYASMAALPDLSGLTAGEQNRLYAMQEDINYVIQNLK